VKRSDRLAVDDAKAILNRVRQLVRALRTFDKQAQSRYGLGAAQMFIVHVLQNEDGLALNELADRTATDQSSVSLAVGKLVTEGYVQRAESAVDRRQVLLSLTPKGRALARRSPPAAQERILESVLAMKRSERTQLTALLDQLIGGLAVAEGPPAMFFQDEEEARPRRRKPATKKRGSR
jgi:DNA-binding MarR family transcriptional regulator